ncbi:hypothetical protein D3C84_1044600 [compost metagenome]
MTSEASAPASLGRPEVLAQGASKRMPVHTWINAIRCGGVPLKRLMINAATAYRNAAPRARPIPSR